MDMETEEGTNVLTNEEHTISSSVSTSKSAGCPRGTTKTEQTNNAKVKAEVVNKIAKKYSQYKNSTKGTRTPRGTMDKIIKEVVETYQLPPRMTISKNTIFSRLCDECSLIAYHCGTPSPMLKVEEVIVNIIWQTQTDSKSLD